MARWPRSVTRESISAIRAIWALESELRDRLRRFGLGLTGGWCDLPFYDDDAYREKLATL